jgi:hypothetical protein
VNDRLPALDAGQQSPHTVFEIELEGPAGLVG